MVKISLQVKPLSINDAFKGRRFKSREYEAYEKEVYYLLPNGFVEGEVIVRFDFYLKNYARVDVDNLCKLLLDIITKKGLIEDDRKVVELVARKHRAEEPRVEIEIESYPQVSQKSP